MATNSPCSLGSAVSSGWNELTSTDPWRHKHGLGDGLGRGGGQGGQHLDPGADPLHHRGPDEHGMDRRTVHARHGQVALEGGSLTAEAVPAHGQVDQPEVVAGRPDRRGRRRPAGSSRRRSRRPAVPPRAAGPGAPPYRRSRAGGTGWSTRRPAGSGRAGRRGPRAGVPGGPAGASASKVATCSRTSPWRASTPTVTGAPHGSAGPRPAHQPRSARCTPSDSISCPAMASPRPVETLATSSASV